MKTTFIFFLFLLILCNNTLAQSYFFEDFENGVDHWDFVDYNNDGRNWGTYVPGAYPSFGTKSISSRSISITPDNLAVSPAVNLSNISLENGNYIALDYQIATSVSNPYEKYSVYITHSSNPEDIVNAVPVYTETVQTGGIIHKKRLDISGYIGQIVYITFRHYDCSQFSILLDNIEVRKMGTNNVKLNNYQLERYTLPNQDNTIELSLTNRGENNITSVNIMWNDGTNDHTSNIPINILPDETVSLQHPFAVNYSDIRQADISITATHVNGEIDFDQADNILHAKINTLSQSITPKILIEEGTGTWCGWCPRGIVAMKYMDAHYSNQFIGIAVHDGDVLENEEYASNSNFAGFPLMHVDRTLFNQHVSSESMEELFNLRRQRKNPAALQLVPDITGRELSIRVNTTFYSNFSQSDFRLAVLVMENNLPGYGQVNYYAGGTNGPMGGFESLPDPIPADMINHDHVAREIIGGYHGTENSIPENITDGQSVEYTFNYTIPEEYNLQNLQFAVVLIDNENGEIVNTELVSLAEMSVNDIEVLQGFSFSPNPASDLIYLKNNEEGLYSVKIYDNSGKAVYSIAQKLISKNQTIAIQLSNFPAGIYIISMEGKTNSYSKRLIIKH
ncbi:T9SS type A sorting domain-containing protein [Moheibacter sediminis]|nr:Omp28-related outer membrane protein [Moheibacter sediminis]